MSSAAERGMEQLKGEGRGRKRRSLKVKHRKHPAHSPFLWKEIARAGKAEDGEASTEDRHQSTSSNFLELVRARP